VPDELVGDAFERRERHVVGAPQEFDDDLDKPPR
jgi:hypothetical protein